MSCFLWSLSELAGVSLRLLGHEWARCVHRGLSCMGREVAEQAIPGWAEGHGCMSSLEPRGLLKQWWTHGGEDSSSLISLFCFVLQVVPEMTELLKKKWVMITFSGKIMSEYSAGIIKVHGYYNNHRYRGKLYFIIWGKILRDARMCFYGAIMFLFNYLWFHTIIFWNFLIL